MPLTDLDYTIVNRHGRPFALWSDGTLLPVIRGGATDEGGSGGGGEGGQDAGQGGGGTDDTSGSQDQGEPPAANGSKPVEFTPEQQAEMGRRIAEERSKAAAAAKKAAEDEAKTAAERAKMDEAERLKAEKADAEKAASDAVVRANARVVTAEAKVQAVEAGADPKQLAYVLKLADLDDVSVDDAGEPDTKAIRKAIDKVLTEVPALKVTAAGKGKSGGEFNGHAEKGRSGNLEDAIAARMG